MRTLSRFTQLVLPVLLLALAACGSLDDEAPVLNSWSAGSLVDDTSQGPRNRSGPQRQSAAEEPAQTAYVEGTGNFLGDAPARSRASGVDADGITLNLVNVPAADAAKTVLGDILSLEYTVDPSVEGRITIQTPKPVSKASVMALFEEALRANNAAISFTGAVYKIVPADQALANAQIGIGKEASPKHPLGSSLRIVQLDYVSATEMKRVLQPISPQSGVVDIDTARNTITLSGNREEIAGMLEAISVFDVDVMKGMSFAMVPVESSTPSIIADELKQVFATEQAGPMAGMVKFLPNKRLGAILAISPQRKYLARAEQWIKRLDAQAAGSERRFYTYKVQNRQAQELVNVISSMFSSGTGRQTETRNVSPQFRESSSPDYSSGAGKASGFGSAFSDSPSTPPDGNGVGSAPTATQIQFGDERDPPFRVVADPAKNTILIEATPKEYRRVLKLFETLDVMPNQVLIEATIAEVTLTDDLRFGVRWYFKEKASSFTFTDSNSGALSSVFPGFSYALAMSNVEATLSALNGITNINIVSSPSLTVMDNKTALLQIGDQVPIATQSAVSVENPDAPIVNSVSYRDTGVILSITPRINESGRVLLDIEQEVSSVFDTDTSEIDSPTIRQRKVKTTVMVSDGQAIALGGLIQKSQSKGRSQIPIIGDLPLLGNAFKSKTDETEKTELIILIKPHVMRNLEEARQITEEFKDEFRARVMDQRDKSGAFERAVRRTFE